MKYPVSIIVGIFSFCPPVFALKNKKEFNNCSPSPVFALNNKKKFTTVELLKSKKFLVQALLVEPGSSQFVIDLPAGVVVDEGGILTSDGYILKDTQNSLKPQHGLMNRGYDINTKNPMFFNGSLAVISSPGSENWYHWLLQVLPRLIILKNSNYMYDRIYVNNVSYDWQRNSLHIMMDFLSIPKDKLLIVNGDCVMQATHLIVPSVPFMPSVHWGCPIPKWLKDNINAIFLDSKKANTRCYDKIYISRSRASIRQIINEEALIAALEKNGFKAVYLEQLTPYEQAHLFNNAKIIVGPHGSGFANLIFAKPGCKLIEIQHGTKPPSSFYKRMAELMSCTYYPFDVDQTTEEHFDDDMEVDVNKFVEFINRL